MSQLQGSTGAAALPLLGRLPRMSPPLWIAAFLLAALAALLPGLWTLPSLVVLAACLLMLLKPEVALYLLTLSVPLGSLAEVELGSFTASPTELLTGLLVLGWAARALSRRRIVLPVTPLSIPLILMVGWVAFSATQATEIALTIKETLKWMELALVYLFIVSEMGSSARQAMVLVVLLLAGAGIEAMLGSVQFVLGIGPGFFAIGRFMRAFGTFDQPNPYAGYLGMLIPLAIGVLMARPGKRMSYYLLAVGTLSIAAVGMSLSRGAWMGIGLGIALMMALWSRRSRVMLAAGTVAATPVAALAFLNLLPDEVTTRLATALDYFRFVDVTQEPLTSQNWAVMERMAHWQAAIDMIARNPLFGVGAGNYPAAYEWYALPGWVLPLGHAHNFYLNIAAETGIPGLVFYLLFVVAGIISAVLWLIRYQARRGETVQGETVQKEDTTRLLWRGILLGVLGGLMASSVHNLFDSLFVHSMSVQLGMLLGLAQVAANALAVPSSTGVDALHE
jgi:putative inorganic carbon (hco3(-)) transporter